MKSKRYGCVICGHRHPYRKCSPHVLRAIEGANTLAWNRELFPHLYVPIHQPTYNQRLARGFEMMADDYQPLAD